MSMKARSLANQVGHLDASTFLDAQTGGDGGGG